MMRLIKFLSILVVLVGLVCSSIGISLLDGSSVHAGALLDSSAWNYRQRFTVEGSPDGLQNDYQMKITIHKGSGTINGDDVYLNNHCKDDFSDVRFTDADGATSLDYWIENNTSSTATVWVELGSVPASPGTADFYIYYDNPSAISASNGSSTFIFFDDFSGTELDTGKWHTTFKDGGGSVVVNGGLCTLQANYGIWSSANLFSNTEFGTDKMLRAYVRSTEASDNHDVGFRPLSDGMWVFNNVVRIENIHGGTTQFGGDVVQDGVQYDGLMGEADTDWHIYEIEWGARACEFYVDTSHAALAVSPSLDMAVWARAEAGASFGVRTLKIDWIALSNYTQNEPVISSWGNEESGSWDNGKLSSVQIGLLVFGLVLVLVGLAVLFRRRAKVVLGAAVSVVAKARGSSLSTQGMVILIIGMIVVIIAVILIFI